MRVKISKPRIALYDDVPSNAIELLQRLCVRDTEIDIVRARATLAALGMNVSPLTVSSALHETRRLIRFLHRSRLLHPDFDVKRRRVAPDFFEVTPKRRRSPR